ncbi:MAG TPA: hypothetical protein VMR50_11105 [Myxococcota bacterium]|nr:hypothetical protein [Myxococcota bacterium]
MACATGALAMDRPVAPSGFTWHDVTEIRAAFLVPDGWHVREEHQDKTFALFITETAFSPPAEFEVGLTVNVFRNTPGAAAKVKQVFDAIAAKYSVKVTPGTSGPFRTLSCHFDSKPASGKEPVRQFQLGIANPKTGTAYLLIFESPVSRWDAAWAKGKPILDALALETEI